MKLRILFTLCTVSVILGAFVSLKPIEVPSVQFPEDKFINAAREFLKAYQERHAFERMYLHTNQTLYQPGETIWFSGYLQALGKQVGPLSDMAYVAIKDAKGNVIQTLRYPVINGKIKGDYTLDARLPGGVYEIKAYTQWMLNYKREEVFSKKIQVQKVIKPRLLLKLDFKRESYGASDWVEATLKARDTKDKPIAWQEVQYKVTLGGETYQENIAMTDDKGEALVRFQLPNTLTHNDGLLNIIVAHNGVSESISRSVPIVLNNITIDFYPEGGNWAAGVAGKMAFKALNEFYKPADIEGVVLDSKGALIRSFKSFHQGMGAFVFTPKAEEQYQVKITKPAGITKLYKLPKAKQETPSLKVTPINAQQLKVQFYAPKTDTFYLLTQSGGKIHFAKKMLASAGISTHKLLVKDYPIGITKITVVNRTHKQICERLVFVNPHKQLKVQIKIPRKAYQPREKVEAEILTTNEKGEPVSANLSVAVVDDKMLTLADDKQDNLLSYMLMSEELKGKIYEPNFYFKKGEPKAKKALDYVMLTHGWRHYDWNTVWGLTDDQVWTNYELGTSFGDPSYDDNDLPHKKEHYGTIVGQVFRKHSDAKIDRTVEAEVTLFELGGQRRALRIRTDKNGIFTFKHVNPFVPVQLLAENLTFRKERCVIKLKYPKIKDAPKLGGIPITPGIQAISDKVLLGEKSKPQKPKLPHKTERFIQGNTTFPVKMAEEGSLNETVISELGIEREAKDATVRKFKYSPGAAAKVMIRGVNTIAGSHEPLVIIDGIPVWSLGDAPEVNPDKVTSIQILRGPSAAALYGARALHGVIFIETYHGIPTELYKKKKFKKKYGTLYFAGWEFSMARIFRAKEYKRKDQDYKKTSKRTDFRNTIYWNPEVITDKQGKAKITFWCNDALTTFRITAEGVGVNNQLGRSEHTFFTKLPFELTAKVPPYFSVGDSLMLPVFLANNTNQTIKGKVKVSAPGAFVFDETKQVIEIAPQTARTVYLNGVVKRTLKQSESDRLEVSFAHQMYAESYSKAIEVFGKGFPVEKSFAGNQQVNQFEFTPKHLVKGSLKVELVAYPNALRELMEGVKSIIKRPYGCFEQVSASTYPNILALQLMQKTGTVEEGFSKKTLKYIKSGYRKLVAYETRENGFEWYGKTPPHEGLTAFGLLEFMEMKKVYNGVSEKMLDRTKRWLLSRKDGKGRFKQNSGKYGFAAASSIVNNAYIVYALSQAGVKDVAQEYKTAFAEAYQSNDAYRMALVTLAAINLDKMHEARQMLARLRSHLLRKELGNLSVDHTLVRATGQSAQIETAALIAMAEMRMSQPDFGRIQQLINYLVINRKGGYFGSTQGTIMALQAITQYAQTKKQNTRGKILVYQGNRQIGVLSYSKNQLKLASFTDLAHKINLKGGSITVKFGRKEEIIPFNLNIRYQTYQPRTSPLCNIDLKTQLSARQVKVNETVRLTTTIRNKQTTGQPSTIAIVGIPSGLSPQPWQLKELIEKKKVAYYEIYGSQIVFYFRELAPNMLKTIHLDLKADVPGLYRAPASSAYLYYTSEYKDWEAGTEILVKPALAN